MSRVAFLPAARLDDLVAALAAAGYQVLGPAVRDGAVQFVPLGSADELPQGVRDEQAPGHYRLHQHDDRRRFAWATGPQALKPLLFAPREVLWRVERDASGALAFRSAEIEAPARAVIGVRACDLAALALTDAHFMNGPYPDPAYSARRARLLLVSVDCARSADTCFCVSTGDGPQAEDGFDIGLTEFDDGYLVRPGSARGAAVLDRLDLPAATPERHAAREAQGREAAAMQRRGLPGRDLRTPLLQRPHHPRWDEVAARCLACGNCTSVCPTCFCHAESEQPVMGLASSEHLREWDSCFSARHSYMHGYQVRADIAPRYRQWLTHKLATWHEQYGRSGCVGCGRCIAWCPAGIDITDEAQALCAGGGES